MASITFIPSMNDRLKLNLNGYLFTKERQRHINFYWKCDQWKSKCKGRAKTLKINGTHILSFHSEHNHSPKDDTMKKTKKTKSKNNEQNTESKALESLIESE